MRIVKGGYSLCNRAGTINVVVFEHEHVRQGKPVVFGATSQNSIFFGESKAWKCLAGIQQLSIGSFQCLDKTRCHVGNAGKVTEKIHDNALGFEQLYR